MRSVTVFRFHLRLTFPGSRQQELYICVAGETDELAKAALKASLLAEHADLVEARFIGAPLVLVEQALVAREDALLEERIAACESSVFQEAHTN